MRPAACEDRGADLFLLARDGAEPAGDLAAHLASCGGCREDLGRLRDLAAAVRASSGPLAPRPATRAAVLVAAGPEAPPAPAPRRPGPLHTFWIPVGALAASAAILVVAVLHSARREAAPAPGVEVRTVFGGPALEGLGAAENGAAHLLSASATASVHLGDPLSVEVVLGAGTRIRVPPRGERGAADTRSLDLLAGAAYFEPGPAPGGGVLRVRLGAAEVEDRGARFAVERRASGAAEVTVETGVVVVRSAGAERAASGPCRVDLAEGTAPPPPSPAAAGDATAWFLYPEVALEKGEREIALVLRPSVPRPIRIAPFHPYDPLFTLRATHPEKGLVEIPLRPKMLLRPAPEADADGAFLLRPDRPYRVAVDPASLGLAPGAWRLEALYASSRTGGLWRGTRASNAVEIVVR